jgi:hypothetical protein
MRDKLKRVAVLGNSHSLVVASALAANPSKYPHVTCFHVFHHWAPMESKAGDGCPRISVHTKRGDEVIAFDEFDLFVVCAGGWWAGRNEHLNGAPSHPLAHGACSKWLPFSPLAPASLRLVSESVFDEMVYSWVSEHAITELVRFISTNHRRKVLWLPWPAPSRLMKRSPDWVLNSWYGENGPRAWLGFFRSQYRALQRLSSEIGDNLCLLPYPSADIMEDGFMDGALCEADPFHGNVRYGSLVVRQLEPLLGVASVFQRFRTAIR